MRRNGFSVVELLIAVLIIGIIAAIAMGNYFNAVNRAKQKKTMADMRAIAVTWEARAVDTKQYNAAGAFTMLPASITHPQMLNMFVPTYVREIPRVDGWGFPLEYTVDQAMGSATGAATYAIRSPGRDGRTEGDTYAGGPTTDYDCDIVYSGGQFMVWPEGTQQK